MSGDGEPLRTEKLTLQTILQRGYEAYERHHRLPDYVRRAVWAILACRTALLGGHIHACPERHLERIWYNSCRHRMCPQCAWVQIERWLTKQKARLLACEPYHVIFTMPHELNDLWLANIVVHLRVFWPLSSISGAPEVAVIPGSRDAAFGLRTTRTALSGQAWAGQCRRDDQLLCASVHDTLVTLLGDPKYLNRSTGNWDTLGGTPDSPFPPARGKVRMGGAAARTSPPPSPSPVEGGGELMSALCANLVWTDLGAKPGIIATLHTWSQTLLLHPHMHCLVTGGGLREAGHWVAVRNGFLWPMQVVMAVFRGTRLAAIRQRLHQGPLILSEGKRLQPMDNLLNTLGRTKWNVHIRERYPSGYPSGQGVLVYLARDVRGGPIAQRRLLACDGEQVVFGYEERAKGPGGQAIRGTMRLPLEQFLGRWRLHVAPPGAVLVRGWGLYAHTQGAALALGRQQLGQGPVEVPKLVDWQSACEGRGEAHPERCPVCGQRLVCVALVPRAGAPPPAATGWEPVA